MSVMFEVYYSPPADIGREGMLTARVSSLGGRLSYRELAENDDEHGICLTFEFDDPSQAELAAQKLRQQGEHVEGPSDYGD